MDAALGLGLLVLGVAVYFLPGIVAHMRVHHQENAIVLLNLFLGWTFIGWVAALVWSAMAVRVEATAAQVEAVHPISKPLYPKIIAGVIAFLAVVAGGGYMGYQVKKSEQAKEESISDRSSNVEKNDSTLSNAVTKSTLRPAWCANAKSQVEKLICNDDELSKLDMELAETFAEAKLAATDKQAFSEQTKARWKQRETECQDRECVYSWYVLRKGELQTVMHEQIQANTTTSPIEQTTFDKTQSNSDVMTRKLSNCLLPKAQYGRFSSFDGGKSAQQLLEGDCQAEYLDFVSTCRQEGRTKDQCLMTAVIAAQFAIKSLNK